MCLYHSCFKTKTAALLLHFGILIGLTNININNPYKVSFYYPIGFDSSSPRNVHDEHLSK